jgi:isoleucyl-tRNA synthetase
VSPFRFSESEIVMTQPAFDKVSAQPNLPAMEEEILRFWDSIDAFHESNRRRSGNEPFVFYDGPPFATGTPHYGHLLAGTIKDIVPRYWNMRGHPIERRFGWDCHGLPIEALAQEALNLSGTAAIKEAGIDVFNEQCRSMVQTYVAEWRKTVTRMGRWVDFDNDYKTMDLDFMESVWWVFKQLWEQGRIYKAHRIMPYSWALTTPLSNFEANSNYKDVQDPAITVRCKVTSDHGLDGDVYLLAWTTTPWTLPENLALCAGPAIDYVAVKDADSGAIYVMAEARLGAYYKSDDQYEVLHRCQGSDLLGWTYEPLFPYFADQPNAFRVLNDGFVSIADGTGIVHMAPAYGEDDYRICRAENIDLVDPLDDEARFQEPVSDYVGQFCKDADKAIIKRLKTEGKLVHQGQIKHSYPFCERTDTPLIYRAIEAWYVKVEDLREQLTSNNDAVHWLPDYVGDKRFGNWLRDAKDWNISRNRFWGSCLPVWINEDDADDMICVGSVDELEQLSGVRVDDLHKHIVDDVIIERDGKRYRRTPEVLDCWFESGAMPYAQQHHPFSGKDIDSFFPADFIAEGLDQTRGWFYTLLILGTCLFGKSPYKNVVVNGLILTEDGTKMSKRKKNYPDPGVVLDGYGADALRAYMINSPVVRAEPLRFSEKGLKEIVRSVVLPYWNAVSFFTTYASVDGFDPRSWDAPALAERPEMDRWILSVLESLVRDVNKEMESYHLYSVVPRLVSFIDDLTNWYIRSNRARFWKSSDRADQSSAFHTLYKVLTTFSTVLAPFMPFVTETVYQKLVRAVDDTAPDSVHWCDFPQVDDSFIDATLEEQMAVIRDTVGLGRKLREEHRIKVRQPLGRLTVVHRDPQLRSEVAAGASRIAAELNVKEVTTEADESAFVTVSCKPNFQTLRQRCPQKLGIIGKTLKDWGHEEVARLEAGEPVTIDGETITLDDVLLHREAQEGQAVATDGHITVVLDTTLTEALEQEGLAREMISVLQNARKQAGFEVTDRIQVTWHSDSNAVQAALATHAETVAAEVLATSFAAGDPSEAQDASLNGEAVRFGIVKA